jgi:predicted DsbA family dithiol-disulfide isomerase
LRDIAREAGLEVSRVDSYLDGEDDVERVYDESRRAHRLGINGVPAFVFNERIVIAGAQEPQVLARMLDAALVTDDAA